jgi:hypothetical protein
MNRKKKEKASKEQINLGKKLNVGSGVGGNEGEKE